MQSIEERNKLVVEYKYLADSIAERRKLTCIKSIQLSELKSAAYFGLLDAATKFDPSKGQFKVYARYRIHGEINDYLRKISKSNLVHHLKSWSLDVPVSFDRSQNSAPLSEVSGYCDSNFDLVDHADDFKRLTSILSSIQKQVIYLYYIRGMNMQAISKRLGYHESRISQIATEARRLMREVFGNTKNEFFTKEKNKKARFSGSCYNNNVKEG